MVADERNPHKHRLISIPANILSSGLDDGAIVVFVALCAVAKNYKIHQAQLRAIDEATKNPPGILQLFLEDLVEAGFLSFSQDTYHITYAIQELAKGEPARAVEMWNSTAERHGLRRVTKLTKTRTAALRRRLDEYGLAGWRQCLTRVAASRFLLGDNDRGWKASFDFVIKESNFVRICEGVHENSAGRPYKGPPNSPL